MQTVDVEARSLQQEQVRQQILEDPAMVLEDQDVIRALIGARASTASDRNVVDIGGVLISRLEDRLDRLEGTHRDVVAAAYENLAGTQQIHRAVLALLHARDFSSFLWTMTEKLKSILTLDAVCLCVEADEAEPGTPLGPEGPYRDAILSFPRDGAAAYCGQEAFWPGRRVILRETTEASAIVFGEAGGTIRSEAILKVEVGTVGVPMLLVLGSQLPERFHPDQATDLLTFLALAFEAVVETWLI